MDNLYKAMIEETNSHDFKSLCLALIVIDNKYFKNTLYYIRWHYNYMGENKKNMVEDYQNLEKNHESSK